MRPLPFTDKYSMRRTIEKAIAATRRIDFWRLSVLLLLGLTNAIFILIGFISILFYRYIVFVFRRTGP